MLREKLNSLSPEEKKGLAEILGVSVRTIDYWRKGRSSPRKNRLPALAAYLGLNNDQLAIELVSTSLKETTMITATAEVAHEQLAVNSAIEAKHIRIIPQFKDKTTAKNINALLLEMEDLDPEAFSHMESFIEGQVQLLRQQLKKNKYPSGAQGKAVGQSWPAKNRQGNPF